MIRLDVEDYCQNCPEFEADVIKCKSGLTGINPDGNHISVTIIDTTISCEHRYRCKTIKEFLSGR